MGGRLNERITEVSHGGRGGGSWSTDLVSELLKFGVEGFAHLAFPLLALELIRVIHRRTSVEGLRRLHHLSVGSLTKSGLSCISNLE